MVAWPKSGLCIGYGPGRLNSWQNAQGSACSAVKQVRGAM